MLVGEVFARMGLDDKQYKKGLDRLESVTQKKALTLGSIFKGAFSFALGIGLMSGFRSLGGAITDFINTAARTEVLDIAMQSVAKSSGYAIAALREQRKSVMELGIAEQEATQILTRFMQAQLDTADAAKLARVAQDAAVISGTNSSQAAEQMTEAIAKQRPILLAQFGMMAGIEEMYSEYAKTVGKSANELTKAEKKQAMLNYILKEGEKIAGTYEASMGAVGKQIGSLPRYWDTLKNAIAKPLALPAISVIVEAITNGLKNAISWAETSQAVLQRWGQAAASAVQKVIGWVGSFTKFIARNWAIISKTTMLVVKGFLYFKVVAKVIAIAKTATWGFALMVSVLRGQSVVTSGALGVLSGALQYYRYQLHLANMAGITSVGLMSRMVIGIRSIGIAIKGLLASIPVIGWIVLAIGLLAEAAIYAYNNWEKAKHYILQVWSGIKQGIAYYVYGILSLYRLLFGWIPGAGAAFDVMRKKALEIARAETAIRQARAQAFGTKAADPYAEYEKKMEEYYAQMEDYGGAADDSLSGVQDGVEDTTEGIEDMNKAAKGGLQAFDEINKLMKETGDIAAGDLGLDEVGLGEMPGMPEMPEMPKMPTLEETGFVERISGMWDDIASSISTGATEAWAEFGDTMKEAWEAFKGDWENIFKAFTWENIKQKFVDGWTGFQSWFSQTWAGQIWDKVKIRWQEVREEFTWANIKQKFINGWTGFQSWFSQTWAGKIWDGVKQKWGNLKKDAPETWENIKKSIAERWEKLKKDAPETWENIKKSIAERWEKLRTSAPTTWEEIRKNISDRWEALKKDAPKTWGEIAGKLADTWEGIKTSASEKWEGVKTVIKGAVNGIINFINKFIRGWNKIELKVPEVNIPLVGTVGGWSVRLPRIPEIPMLAKGGLVTAPTLTMLGEAGPEAVLPLERNTGWIDQLAEKIASALTSAIQTQQSGAALDGPVAIYLQVDKTMLGKITARSLRELQRQGGGALIPV